MSNETAQFFNGNQQILILTEILKEQVYNKLNSTKESFDAWLQKYSYCIEDFLSKKCTKNDKIFCDQSRKYRTVNGVCNNFKYPKVGAANTQYGQILDSSYADEVHSIRLSDESCSKLPEARQVIYDLFINGGFRKVCKEQCKPNVLNVMFGQFMTHDAGLRMDVTTDSSNPFGINCCSADLSCKLPIHLTHPACSAMHVKDNDLGYKPYKVHCLNFIRSQTTVDNSCSLTPAKQVNTVTAFLDLSQVYGNDELITQSLRKLKKGKMKIDKNGVVADGFKTGDIRSNQTPFLLLFQSLFLRYHNYIADNLGGINKHWDDDKLFEESRRILIAIYQAIIYEEWLGTWIESNTKFTDTYEENIDPSNTNEFNTAAFRAFHILIGENFVLYNEELKVSLRIKISDSVGRSDILRDSYNDVLRGSLYRNYHCGSYSDQILQFLFKVKEDGIGLALPPMDIQRGRDHGLQPYYKYAMHCGARNIKRFEDFAPLISLENIGYLKKVYKKYSDVDLLAGGLLESDGKGFFGPTIRCLIKEQFKRFKLGDQFFYTNRKSPHPFSEKQIDEIRKMTISRLICEVTDIHVATPNGFFGTCNENKIDKCCKLAKFNFELWRE